MSFKALRTTTALSTPPATPTKTTKARHRLSKAISGMLEVYDFRQVCRYLSAYQLQLLTDAVEVK